MRLRQRLIRGDDSLQIRLLTGMVVVTIQKPTHAPHKMYMVEDSLSPDPYHERTNNVHVGEFLGSVRRRRHYVEDFNDAYSYWYG